MANKLDVSDIANSIRVRIKQIEEQLKHHQNLGDELERLRSALSRLEGQMRSRVNAGRRGRRPVIQRKNPTARTKSAPAAQKTAAAPAKTSAAPAKTSTAKSTNARAPRGQNKAKILESLKDGPKTASQIAKEHPGLSTGTVSSTLAKMAKDRDVIKAERGYALPK